MSIDQQDGSVASARGTIAARISREIVQLHANLYGRGPTKAKTHVNDDHVLSILEDVFTPAERTLVGAGHEEQVQATRSAFQAAVADQFQTIVENVTGRRVRAFMSAVSIDPEIATEFFLLEPVPESDGLPQAAATGAQEDGASGTQAGQGGQG